MICVWKRIICNMNIEEYTVGLWEDKTPAITDLHSVVHNLNSQMFKSTVNFDYSTENIIFSSSIYLHFMY